MTEPSLQTSSRPAGLTLRFLLVFAAFLVVFSLGVFLPPTLLHILVRGTGVLVVFCAGIFGISASFEGTILTVSGFRMEIILECTALQYLGLYAAGVVAYPYKTVRSKAGALMLGIPAFLAINVARLIVIGKIGAVAPALFEFVHVYLWQSMFGIMVFCIWLAWVQSFEFRRLPVRKALLFAVLSAVVLVAVRGLLGQIVGFIAWLSQGVFSIMPMLGDITVAVRQNLIVLMLFRSEAAFDLSVYDISTDIFASSLVLPLLAVVTATFRKFVSRLGLAVLVLLVMHLLAVSVAGYFLHFSIAGEMSTYFTWYLHVVALIVPVLIVVFFRQKDRAGLPATSSSGS